MSRNRYHRNEDSFLEFQKMDAYNYYWGRLRSLAMSQFEWNGLPDTIDEYYLERIAFENGTVAVYKPRYTDCLVATGYVNKSGRFNIYGYPTEITGISQWLPTQIETDEFRIMYDNRARTPIINRLEYYAKRLARADLTADNNMMRQNSPYIVTSDKKTLLTTRNIFQRIFSFDPLVEVNRNVKLDDQIQKIDLDVPFKANEIMDYKTKLWNEAISLLGIAAETTKKERLIGDEVALNRQEDTVSLNSRLLERVKLADYLNKRYGLNVTVNMSEMAIKDPGLVDDGSTPSEPNTSKHTIEVEDE